MFQSLKTMMVAVNIIEQRYLLLQFSIIFFKKRLPRFSEFYFSNYKFTEFYCKTLSMLTRCFSRYVMWSSLDKEWRFFPIDSSGHSLLQNLLDFCELQNIGTI